MQDTFQWTTELVNEYAGTFLLQAMKAIEAARNGSTVEKIISASEFIASKAPKKEWEIVELFADGGDPIPAYAPAGWTEEWVAEKLKEGRLKIHSVRRLSDGEVFVKNEVVGTPSDGQHHIGGFEVRGNFLYVQFSIGQITIEHLQKLPEPILTTYDGVDIYEGMKYWPVSKDTLNIYTVNIASEVDRGKWGGAYLFSTREAAEEYILNHAEKLSLNDVKEVLDSYDIPDPELILLKLTALVKQKLNQ